jgi:16S rRNA (guanine527-N7)-methyltransferase
MDQTRIAELLIPFLGFSEGLTPKAQGLLPGISTYIDILLRWNSKINLTAIRDPEQIVTRHFGESLFAARYLFPATVPNVQEPEGAPTTITSLADLGSGAGFPGIPIKLWAPDVSVTLIESNQKKAAFLKEIVRALTLTDINIQNTRAESLAGTSFDAVTLRAVDRFESVLPVAASLVAAKGRLALLIGTAQQADAHRLLPRYAWTLHPIPESQSRILLIGRRSS